MTARFGRLDLTLSAHLMNDGSGSHCRMMSASPWMFNILLLTLLRTCLLGVFISTTVDKPNVLTYMLSTFSPPVPATSFNMR